MLLGVHGARASIGQRFRQFGEFFIPVRQVGHARYRCRLNDGPHVNRHRPSVDVMFRSVAHSVGPNAVGILLTGMGDDGARGLKEMLEAGARTVAQDEQSSVVWGMPGSAVKLGAAELVQPLSRIPQTLLELAAQAGGVATAAAAHG